MSKKLTEMGLSIWVIAIVVGILVAIATGIAFFIHPTFSVWLLLGFIVGMIVVPQVGFLNLVLFLLVSFVQMSSGWLMFIRWLVLILTIAEVFVWFAIFGVSALLSKM